MTQNSRTPLELKHALDAIVAELKALDAASIADVDIVPLAHSVKDVGAYIAALDAQINVRVLTNNVMLPGASTKDKVVHRKWHDEETAAALAREQFGDKAFNCSLLSPAAIEKLGPEGKALVAVASYKPEAGKAVVY